MLARVPRVRLRTVLICFFVLQVTVTTVLVSFVALRNGQEAVNVIVTQLLAEVRQRVEERLYAFVGEAPRANQEIRATLETGLIGFGEDDKWLHYFWRQKDRFPSISYFTVTDATGEWVGLQTHPRLEAARTEAGGLSTYAVTEAGTRGALVRRLETYSAADRDWFRLPQDLGRPVWTPIYVWADAGVLSMSLSEPLFDAGGRLAGLTTADLALGEIHEYLRTIEVGMTGRAFLMEPDGNLIASSAAATPFIETDDGPIRVLAQDFSDVMVSRSVVSLSDHFGSLSEIRGTQQIRFDYDHGAEHVIASRFADEIGLDWLLVIVVPEDDFMGGIYASTRTTVLICIGILVLTVIFGLVYSARISRPLKTLSDQVSRVQELKLDNVFNLGSSVAEVNSMEDALGRMQAGLSSFRRYVPADLVRQILELGEEATLGGDAREVTVLFSDLQGYSTIVEERSPEDVITFVNQYFEAMQDVITRHGGVVIELLGDAILAVFGAPGELPGHATAATRCAIAMRDRLRVLNDELDDSAAADRTPRLSHRIGIHTGKVVAGNIGGRSYMKYGVIGDVVNVAARLEQRNKETNTSILISDEVLDRLPSDLAARAAHQGEIQLKGRRKPQGVHSL